MLSRSVLVAAAVSCVAAHLGPHRLSLYKAAEARWQVDAGASIEAYPSVINSGDYVQVAFVNPNPTTKDFVGAFTPSTANISGVAPVEWFAATSFGPDYPTTGVGALSFRTLNMAGDDYSFVLFTGSVDKPVAIAASNAVTFFNVNAPFGMRLAVTGAADGSEMRVTWNSAPAASANARVIWSPVDGSSPNQTAPALTYSYNASDMCGSPAVDVGYRPIGAIHSAVMSGLQPGAAYTYQVGDDAGGFSAPAVFRVPPAGYPFYFGAVGDVGQNTVDGSSESDPFTPAVNTTRLGAADAAAGLAHVWLHHGDISYARGYAAHWFTFLDNIQGISAHIPYMLDSGNHERDFPGSASWLNGTDSGGECGVPTTRLFPMPGYPMPPAPSTPGQGVMLGWWAAKIGPLFALHFNTELWFTKGSDQWNFIATTLASVNRSDTPWVVVSFHRPMYISSTNNNQPDGDQPVASLLREHVEPLLMNAGGAPVDIVAVGHHHSYQKTCAVYANACVTQSSGGVYRNPGAPIHLVLGTGGAGFSTNIQTPQPPQFETVAFLHGYGRFGLLNDTTLHYQFINDADGSVADEFFLVKGE